MKLGGFCWAISQQLPKFHSKKNFNLFRIKSRSLSPRLLSFFWRKACSFWQTLDTKALYRCTVRAMSPTIIEFPAVSRSTSWLEGKPEEYEVSAPNVTGVLVTVTHKPTGKQVYIGPGPVDVYRSPAPF